jgi:hypothetical protein
MEWKKAFDDERDCECSYYMCGPACNPDYWKQLMAKIKTWPEVEESQIDPPEQML